MEKYRCRILNEFQILNFLGNGAFGVVFTACRRQKQEGRNTRKRRLQYYETCKAKGVVPSIGFVQLPPEELKPTVVLKRVYAPIPKGENAYDFLRNVEREIQAFTTFRTKTLSTTQPHPHIVHIRKVTIETPPPGWIEKFDPCWKHMPKVSPDSTKNCDENGMVVEMQICPVTIVQEYCSLGSLRMWLDREENEGREMALKFASQIADGLRFLHHRRIIHRDLKPENIFLVDNRWKTDLRIGDFGLARIPLIHFGKETHGDDNESGIEMTAGRGTRPYMSPEQENQDYSDKVDVYALGIIYFELFVYFPPAKRRRIKQLKLIDRIKQEADSGARPSLDKINNLIANHQCISHLDEELLSLIFLMLSTDPKLRPTPQNILVKLLQILNSIVQLPITLLPSRPNPYSIVTQELTQLLEIYEAQQQFFVVVTGGHGTGKTELTLRFAEAIATRQGRDSITWVSPYKPNSLKEELQKIGNHLSIDTYKESGLTHRTSKLVSDIHKGLGDTRWILILDGLNNLYESEHATLMTLWKLTASPEPHPKPFILITSRDENYFSKLEEDRDRYLSKLISGHFFDPYIEKMCLMMKELWDGTEKLGPPVQISLTGFMELEALTFLTNRVQSDTDDTEDEQVKLLELCKELEFLPLTLELAGAYIRAQKEVSNSYRISNYLDLLLKSAEEFEFDTQNMPYNWIKGFSYIREPYKNAYVIRLVVQMTGDIINGYEDKNLLKEIYGVETIVCGFSGEFDMIDHLRYSRINLDSDTRELAFSVLKKYGVIKECFGIYEGIYSHIFDNNCLDNTLYVGHLRMSDAYHSDDEFETDNPPDLTGHTRVFAKPEYFYK